MWTTSYYLPIMFGIFFKSNDGDETMRVDDNDEDNDNNMYVRSESFEKSAVPAYRC